MYWFVLVSVYLVVYLCSVTIGRLSANTDGRMDQKYIYKNGSIAKKVGKDAFRVDVSVALFFTGLDQSLTW